MLISQRIMRWQRPFAPPCFWKIMIGWVTCPIDTEEGVMERLTGRTLLAAYQVGQRVFHNLVIVDVDMFEADLRNIALQGSQLINAYLPYSNFSQANLASVELIAAHLGDANLYCADLTQANLQDALLTRADLRSCCLRGANLQGVNLQWADLRLADLTQCDLRGANLEKARLKGAVLNQTQLQGANLFRAEDLDWQQAFCDRSTILPDGHRYSNGD